MLNSIAYIIFYNYILTDFIYQDVITSYFSPDIRIIVLFLSHLTFITYIKIYITDCII